MTIVVDDISTVMSQFYFGFVMSLVSAAAQSGMLLKQEECSGGRGTGGDCPHSRV